MDELVEDARLSGKRERHSQMDDLSGTVTPGVPIGSLELPQELFQALKGSRGDEGVTRVTDLPAVVLGSILSRVPDPVDVASAFNASRLFWDLSKSAPFRLRLRPFRGAVADIRDELGLPSRTCRNTEELAASTRATLTGIRHVMQSTEELDLAGCQILDDDVTVTLVHLCCLDRLVLDGCQKLTSSVLDTLAGLVTSGPRVLSLQRCFRLGPVGAGNLVAAAAVDGSRLRAILLSHLDRLDLPREPPLSQPVGDGNRKSIGSNVRAIKSVGSSNFGAGLRILALHNCAGLGYSDLVAIAKTCPHLVLLMLGGSVSGLGLARPDNVPEEKAVVAISSLTTAVDMLSNLRVLEITFFTPRIVQSIRKRVSSNLYVLDFSDKYSVTTAAALVINLKNSGRSVGEELFDEQAKGMPHVSDCRSIACDHLSSKSEHAGSKVEVSHTFRGDGGLEDLSVGENVNSERPGIVPQQCSIKQGLDRGWDCVAEDVLMALKAGTNCSDARKRTPLHIAAASGEPEMVANLLSIGATEMKDFGGATALFVAAELGYAQVCDHLLHSGADVLASNRSGETPLYIAALRGYSATVEVLLSHCLEREVNWQSPDVYGDGWTPLMAATVANRQDVGKTILLWAARGNDNCASLDPKFAWDNGQEEERDLVDNNNDDSQRTSSTSSSSSSSSAGKYSLVSPLSPLSSAPQVLDAQNRYGQTALHIAARRGSLWFMSHLLRAGASQDIKDNYGDRALDVARKHNHSSVEALLKKQQNAVHSRHKSKVRKNKNMQRH